MPWYFIKLRNLIINEESKSFKAPSAWMKMLNISRRKYVHILHMYDILDCVWWLVMCLWKTVVRRGWYHLNCWNFHGKGYCYRLQLFRMFVYFMESDSLKKVKEYPEKNMEREREMVWETQLPVCRLLASLSQWSFKLPSSSIVAPSH